MKKQNEIWKTIPDTNERYEASNLGRIRRIAPYTYRNGAVKMPNGVLKQHDNGKGYMTVVLSINGNTKKYYVHRLVAAAFIENPDGKRTVNHKDGNRHNNNVENLEWTTYKENNEDMIARIKRQRGNDHPKRNGKLSKPVVQLSSTGEFIKEYPSYREAFRETNINSIDKVCAHKPKRKTAGGYRWMYKDEYLLNV